jgi:hypothetical protein
MFYRSDSTVLQSRAEQLLLRTLGASIRKVTIIGAPGADSLAALRRLVPFAPNLRHVTVDCEFGGADIKWVHLSIEKEDRYADFVSCLASDEINTARRVLVKSGKLARWLLEWEDLVEDNQDVLDPQSVTFNVYYRVKVVVDGPERRGYLNATKHQMYVYLDVESGHVVEVEDAVGMEMAVVKARGY